MFVYTNIRMLPDYLVFFSMQNRTDLIDLTYRVFIKYIYINICFFQIWQSSEKWQLKKTKFNEHHVFTTDTPRFGPSQHLPVIFIFFPEPVSPLAPWSPFSSASSAITAKPFLPQSHHLLTLSPVLFLSYNIYIMIMLPLPIN